MRTGGMGGNGRKWEGKRRIQSSTSLIQDRQSIPSPHTHPPSPQNIGADGFLYLGFAAVGLMTPTPTPLAIITPPTIFFLDQAEE